MNINEIFTKTIDQLTKILQSLKRYQTVIFIVFLALIFGFLIYSVNSLSGRQPDEAAVSAQLKGSASPHIDENSVAKIKQLQDNSVQVKTLFNQARNNPFSE